MKPQLLALLLLLCTTACVTAGDLRAVADSVGRLQDSLRDETKTTAELRASITQTKTEIQAVATNVEARSDDFLGALTGTEGGVSGIISIAAALGLNYWRNRQRELRGEPVKPPPKRT